MILRSIIIFVAAFVLDCDSGRIGNEVMPTDSIPHPLSPRYSEYWERGDRDPTKPPAPNNTPPTSGDMGQFECYSCEEEPGVLDAFYISKDCNKKVECDGFCVDVTYKYSGLSYRKRGCVELMEDSPCNTLWSDCVRDVCDNNLCNSSPATTSSLLLVLISAAVMSVTL